MPKTCAYRPDGRRSTAQRATLTVGTATRAKAARGTSASTLSAWPCSTKSAAAAAAAKFTALFRPAVDWRVGSIHVRDMGSTHSNLPWLACQHHVRLLWTPGDL